MKVLLAPHRIARAAFLLPWLAYQLGVGLLLVVVVLFCSCQQKAGQEAKPAALSSPGQGPSNVAHAKTARGISPKGMVRLPGGIFLMGVDRDQALADDYPQHRVSVRAFWMDEHEVTNAQFAEFVQATHYATVAERQPDPQDFPGIPESQLVAGSAVFAKPPQPVALAESGQWWQYVPGANWRQPLGPGSSVAGRTNDPVVQVCYEDAQAYARWVGKRLPTEAEWEFAARAGQRTAGLYYWGQELTPNGEWMANLFQGDFPAGNTRADGFEGVAPVKSFPPNPWGLYDMEGNVWEWCSDYYRPDYYRVSPTSNPAGPADSHDPEEPGLVKRVQRGGSFLCSDQYCRRYQAGSRGKGEVRSAANNLGFRCVQDIY
ncbi:formylglycine-generating enzyme family protein [Hymenobacter sp. HD11105]